MTAWFSTLVLGLLTAFAPLSIDMYLPALTAITRDLATTPANVQLTLSSFMAGMGLGQLIYGPVSDRVGRRGPLLCGIALYVAASVGCAYAPSVEMLIVLRFFQALGAASGPVIARAVVRDVYSGSEVARMLSLLMLVMGAAPILAPLLGGALLSYAGWRAIFAALSGIGALAFVAAWPSVPSRPSANQTAFRADVRALLSDRQFIVGTLAGGCALASMFAYIAGAPFVFMGTHGYSSAEFAWLFGANAAGLIAASQLNRLLLRRTSPLRVAILATRALLTLSAVLLLVALRPPGPTWPLLIPLFGCVALVGLIAPNTSALALERHALRAGSASSVLGAVQFAAAAVASVLVSVFNEGGALTMALVIACSALCAWLVQARGMSETPI